MKVQTQHHHCGRDDTEASSDDEEQPVSYEAHSLPLLTQLLVSQPRLGTEFLLLHDPQLLFQFLQFPTLGLVKCHSFLKREHPHVS